MNFVREPNKAEINLLKHGISFQKPVTVFGDGLDFTVCDPDHSRDEGHYRTIGQQIARLA